MKIGQPMSPVLALTTRLRPKIRRLTIMLMDVLMVLASIPVTLALSNSRLSFDPFSWWMILFWSTLLFCSHVLFRANGLYNMVWRFASTPDFFNIIKSCSILALSLYLISRVVSILVPFTGLNERTFIILFFVTFASISTPRLVYRYMREGRFWGGANRGRGKGARRALFLGNLDEIDVVIRYMRTNESNSLQIVGIVSSETNATPGLSVHGVPVVADPRIALQVVEEYVQDTSKLDLIVVGQTADKDFDSFLDIVRVARNAGVAVEQFSGVFNASRNSKLVLETVEMETILRRPTILADTGRLSNYLAGKKVLVTGGAGSIGRRLVKRALELNAASVLVADNSEFNIFQLQFDCEPMDDPERLDCRILDITDKSQVLDAVKSFQPDVIFHAAALKHVPLLEINWTSAIRTNVIGTSNCVEAAAECQVPQFVLISSDKAADPSSVLGLTKRVAEQIVNAMHGAMPAGQHRRLTNFLAVRFGNVFGSDGSVATIFQKQIASGGPVTLTDPEMTRYFMTMSEAVDLVIMASAVSAQRSFEESHGIYMLDMGQPVSIITVAETMIRLAGLKPGEDIPIQVVGSRPGEKMHEKIIADGERQLDIGENKIFGLQTGLYGRDEVDKVVAALKSASMRGNRSEAIAIMRDFYRPALDIAWSGQSETIAVASQNDDRGAAA